MGATFILMGDDREEYFEGVDSIKYLGQVLHQTENDWPEVLQNIWREREVCGAAREVAEAGG